MSRRQKPAHQKTKWLLTFGASLFFWQGAQAGVIIEGAKITLKETTQVPVSRWGASPETDHVYNPYVHSGAAPATVQRTTSNGVKQPFSRAVHAIVPAGWKGYLKDDRISQIADMTWTGANRPWTEVLGEMLVSHRLVATVDWTNREISFDISPAYKH